MNILKKKEPFPHIIIENHYTDEELFHIWKELEFLSYKQKLEPAEKTGTATLNSEPLKNNYGVFLDSLYKSRDISSILTINRKIFDSNFTDEISSFDLIFGTYKICNFDRTLVSYYENTQEYKSHYDLAVFTGLSWLFREPKFFKGGDLYFPDYDYKCEVKNNKFILFPSFLNHQVFKVSMPSYVNDKFGMFSTNGRYCISQFIRID